MVNKKNNLKILFFIIFTMILLAISDNIKGALVPLFKETFSIDNAKIGYVFTFGSIGYISFTYIGGILCEKIGQKKTYGLGIIFCILSSFLFYKTYEYKMLLFCMFLLNVGIGLISISINTLVPIIAIGFQALAMNLTHFSYGLGSALTQISTGSLLSEGFNWRSIYAFIGILFVISFLIFIFIKIPQNNIKLEDNKNKGLFNVLKNKYFYFYALGLGFYVFAEVGTSNWLVNFSQSSYHFDYKKSTMYMSLFFMLLTLGRLIGGFIVEKIGYLKSVIISLSMAFLLYMAGLVIGSKAIILICLSGLFFSIAFPTIVATIRNVFKVNAVYISGVIITSASIINMILNNLMGYLSDIIGTEKAFYIIPISLILSITFLVLIYKNIKNFSSR